jgi:hypothetical protein
LSEAQQALLRELEELLRIVARRPDLTLEAGESGCPWMIRMDSGRVQCDPEHLATRSADFCRGLALHEAAHACLTLYHQLLPPELLRAPGMLQLLNVVEDCRIETWLQASLPGSRPWIDEYNDVLFGNLRSADPAAPASVQFLQGLLARWWYGSPPAGMRPEAAEALEAATPGLLRATTFYPPPLPLGGPFVEAAYLRHPAARAFLALDLRTAPTDAQRLARMAQYGAWEVTYREILPHFRGLLAREPAPQRSDPFAQLLQRLAGAHIQDPDAGARGSRLAQPWSLPGSPTRPAGGSGADTQAAVERALQVDPRDRYLGVWKQLHEPIDRLSRDLLEVFEKRNRSRRTRGHATGVRIDLPAVMQFEADPRLYRKLWERISRPDRVDPALLLLIDRSGSMQGENIARTFEGIVLLSEVAARVGLPLELTTFADAPRQELQWDEGVGAAIRRRLGELPERCDGGTDLARALAECRARVEALPFRDIFLIVLSDGATADPAGAARELRSLRAAGVRCVGLGLGSGAEPMRGLFPGDPVGVTVEEVPQRLMTILRGFLAA